MEIPVKPSSRKKFLFWGAGLLGSVTILRFFSKPKAIEKEAETVKMLTADGKLVEVNKSALASKTPGKKASNTDILAWMKNPSK